METAPSHRPARRRGRQRGRGVVGPSLWGCWEQEQSQSQLQSRLAPLPRLLLLLLLGAAAVSAATGSASRRSAFVAFRARRPQQPLCRQGCSRPPQPGRSPLLPIRMAAAPPAANAAPSSPARPFPSSSSSTAAGATTKAWVVTTAAPSAGPREAVLLRRLRGVDPEIEAVEVQEFYFMRTREGAQEDGGLAEGVMGVLREASAAGAPGPAPPAAVGASTTEMGRESHHCHYHWRAYAPRPAFRSVWGSNVRSILAARGLLADEGDPRLPTLEAGRWYRVRKASGAPLGEEAEALLHDRMTECAFLPLLPNTADGASPPAAAWGAVGATALPTPLPAAMLLDTEAKTGTVTLPLRARGPVVLEEASAQYGLGLGPWEVGFLTELFWDPAHGIERDPTAMEIFDVAQSLSEHCRHWTFDGRFVVDGAERRESLMEMVKAPLRRLQQQQQEQDGDGAGGGDDDNSVLAFEDNSSAIRGPTRVLDFQPARPDGPSPYVRVEGTRHPILTAETHNFPCSIAPFPGAQTGVGGRIRDILATGRGAKTLAGLAGYAVGDVRPALLLLEEEEEEEEEEEQAESSSIGRSRRPPHVAHPLAVLLRASDGASDYANKYGEPLLGGFARAMAPWPDAAGAEFLKPIMFSAGIGALPGTAVRKRDPKPGMAVVKIGGPAYRVGLGGGAASSKVGGEPELDLQAVQRGDPEMGNRVGRVVRACLEMEAAGGGSGGGEEEVLASVHDQGAGGNANVLKELVSPSGADVYLGRVRRGDASLAPLEVWGAEYQESQGVLVDGEAAMATLRRICAREAAPVEVVGTVAGHGRIRVFEGVGGEEGDEGPPLVDLPLQPLLSHRPRRVINATTAVPPPWQAPLTTSSGERPLQQQPPSSDTDIDLRADLRAVLGLVSVGSKAFLTNKVDRSVTGLVAAQPCVGPLGLPVGDVGVAALSYWGRDGVASALGECPGVGLLDVEAMARMALGEALTNLAAAPVSRWADIKLQANWMWPGRDGPAAAALYQAVEALRDALLELGLALDGGKDSLSMATETAEGGGERVPSPPTVVLTAYAPCVDVGGVVTPDIKVPFEEGAAGEEGVLLHVDLSGRGRKEEGPRLGGSALAQVLVAERGGALDDAMPSSSFARPPDLRDPALLRRAFEAVQRLAHQPAGAGPIIRAMHDVSAGGLIATVLEMALTGGGGARVTVPPVPAATTPAGSVSVAEAARAWLFGEELGWVLEVRRADLAAVERALAAAAVPHRVIGASTRNEELEVMVGGRGRGSGEVVLLKEGMAAARAAWEATSLRLERLQANPACVAAEERSLPHQRRPTWHVPFRLLPSAPSPRTLGGRPPNGPPPHDGPRRPRRPRVGILREQGSNGDREMAAAFTAAGFEAWDLTVYDLVQGAVSLAEVDGLAFVGGFSYGDALGSARGWASVMQGNPRAQRELRAFFARPDAWSLGLCNGCQLLAALGVVPGLESDGGQGGLGVALAENESGRFESRFVSVRVEESEGGTPAVLLRGMEGAVLGVWSAHGEGRFAFRDGETQARALAQGLAPLRYVDPSRPAQGPTEAYPHNPNGSPEGIAALCSPCGRHLAVMPHPERSWLAWQMPWVPRGAVMEAPGASTTAAEEEEATMRYSPWFRLFQNAYAFSVAQQEREARVE